MKQIALETGLSNGTINNVLGALVNALSPFFRLGHGAYIGRSGKEEDGLGIIYPKLVRTKTKVAQTNADGSEVTDSDGNVVYDTNVELSVGVGFRASTALRNLLEEISVKDVTEDDDTEEDDSEGSTSGGSSSGTNTGGNVDADLQG